MKREGAEAEAVWRLVEGHLQVGAVLGNVQVPRLPDWGWWGMKAEKKQSEHPKSEPAPGWW